MLDSDIRSSLIHLLRQQDASATIIDELPLLRGKGRADLAFVNGSLSGYEIKSDRDSLRRLGDQVQHYDRVFEYATVVVTRSHLQRSRRIVPPHWGIFLVSDEDGMPAIRRVRAAKRNRDADANALARLLWKRECVRALTNNNISASISTPVLRLWEAVAELPKSRLLQEVREALKARRADG